jgi:hypothetical protein
MGANISFAAPSKFRVEKQGVDMAKAPSNHNKLWTPQQERQLRQETRENTPTRVIGLHLGRTESAVRGKAADLNLSLKPTNQSPYNRRPK